MLRFVVRRLLLLVPILLGLSILVFLWIRALPGAPAEALLGERATPEVVAQIRRPVRARRPVYRPVLALPADGRDRDLGTSISLAPADHRGDQASASRRPIELALAAMVFAIFIGVPLGFRRREAVRPAVRPREPGRCR